MRADCAYIALLFGINLLNLKAENIKSNAECIKPKVSVRQDIKNDGFHKDVELNVDLLDVKNILENDCKMSLKVYTSNGFFINPDEIQELIRTKKISAIVDNTVDIEAPAHEAAGHEMHIFVSPISENIKLNYGIHLRYHRAQILGGYAKIPLKPLKVLMQCSKIDICGDNIIIAPCDDTEEKPCNWREVSYQSDISPTELRVPVGDLDDYPLVAIISLSLGCAGTLYLLSLLSATTL